MPAFLRCTVSHRSGFGLRFSHVFQSFFSRDVVFSRDASGSFCDGVGGIVLACAASQQPFKSKHLGFLTPNL